MSDFFIVRKPAAVWTAENPVLPESYIGVETSLVNGVEVDTLKAKLFDGVHSWNALSYWNPAGSAGTGDVVGPASSTDNAIARFDLATGKLIQNSVVTIADSTGNIGGTVTFNKVTITPPATGSTLTIADGKTLTASNSITLAGTDGTTVTLPPASASVGYLGIPANVQTVDYTLVLADSGKKIIQTGATKTITIPANTVVAFPIDTAITFIATDAGGCSIAITTDTMTLANSTTTGTRTLAQNGIATATKLTATTWIVSGVGLT